MHMQHAHHPHASSPPSHPHCLTQERCELGGFLALAATPDAGGLSLRLRNCAVQGTKHVLWLMEGPRNASAHILMQGCFSAFPPGPLLCLNQATSGQPGTAPTTQPLPQVKAPSVKVMQKEAAASAQEALGRVPEWGREEAGLLVIVPQDHQRQHQPEGKQAQGQAAQGAALASGKGSGSARKSGARNSCGSSSSGGTASSGACSTGATGSGARSTLAECSSGSSSLTHDVVSSVGSASSSGRRQSTGQVISSPGAKAQSSGAKPGPAPSAAQPRRACAACGGRPPGPDTKLQACSRCRAVVYCGVGCQKAHWPVHKGQCKQLKGDRQQRKWEEEEGP